MLRTIRYLAVNVKRVVVSWSGGKDSAWALHVVRTRGDCEVVALLTTMNAAFDRVAMHAIRREVVEAQARAAGLPLWTVPLPWPCSNEHYETAMSQACKRSLSEGVSGFVFGDLFLADIRAYREKQLAGTGLEPIFPLWLQPTADLAREMISAGLRARLTCVDPKQIASSFAGQEFDAKLLSDLPATCDPCGEKGEFHTCMYAGPMFASELRIENGEVAVRDGFVFADMKLNAPALLSADGGGAFIGR
ncbi:MAG: Dph6-related ATP pyrophosphatase [Terriglobales bacterium]